MLLSEAEAKRAKPREKVYQLAVGDGLSLAIEPTGQKIWKLRYTQGNKRKTKRLGTYPEISIKQAVSKKNVFLDGLNETSIREVNPTFEMVAQEWLNFKIKNSLGDKPRNGVLVLASKCIERDINPVIGHIIFEKVKRTDLVKVIRLIESKGVKEPCKKACSYLNQIYDYAVSIGYSELNIATNLQKILIKTKIKQNYAFLSGTEIIEFYEKIYHSKCEPITKKALYLKILTGVRGAELLNAKAEQFDLDKGLWFIPAIQVKQFRRKVIEGHKVPDYVIPLSKQAIEIVSSAMEWSVGEKYLFSSPKKVGQHLHYNALNRVIRSLGYDKDKLTSHGLRASMSTVLNESNLFKSEWIEAQLSHTDKNAVRGTYNHAEYIEHRAKMVQWWADYLERKVSIF